MGEGANESNLQMIQVTRPLTHVQKTDVTRSRTDLQITNPSGRALSDLQMSDVTHALICRHL